MLVVFEVLLMFMMPAVRGEPAVCPPSMVSSAAPGPAKIVGWRTTRMCCGEPRLSKSGVNIA